MKKSFVSAGLLIFCAATLAVLYAQETKSSKMYTVGGRRHGISYFARVDYPETRPLVPGEMDFKH